MIINLLFVAGFLAFVTGLALISVPWSLVFGGAVLMACSLFSYIGRKGRKSE